ncbi:MAG: hypothetical protein QM791_21600 [Ferruginibacter sp.]
MDTRKLHSIFAFITGCFFLIAGIWAMFSPKVFGLLSINYINAAICIVLGVLGIYRGYEVRGRTYCILTGIFLLVTGLLRLIREYDDFIVELLDINETLAYANIIWGATLLITGIMKSKIIGHTVMIFKRLRNDTRESSKIGM